MKDIYLEITFRKGKPLAGYIYLNRKLGIEVSKSKKCSDGLVVDFDKDEKIIGIEITAPNKVTSKDINSILNLYHLAPLSEEELAPLKAA